MQPQWSAELADRPLSRRDAAAAGSIAVVLVEDQLALRKGLELLLCGHGYRVVGATRSPERAVGLVGAQGADVALVDIDLTSADGIRLARRLLRERPGVGILLYSGSERAEVLSDALACGAHGLALKAAPPEELLDALAAVAQGDTWLDPRLPRLLRRSAGADPAQRLSAREHEVLLLLADGMTGQAVAAHLYLSPETIRTHVRNAMRKLGARTRSHAIAMLVRGRCEPAGTAPFVSLHGGRSAGER